MRNNNGSLEYCDIIVVLKDITYFKNTLRFHFTTLSHPKKSSGSLKYTITMDSVVVRFVTLYEKSSKRMVQPLDYNEGYLLCLLKELPKVFKLQQSLADSLQLSDDDFDDHNLSILQEGSNQADSRYLSLPSQTDRDVATAPAAAEKMPAATCTGSSSQSVEISSKSTSSSTQTLCSVPQSSSSFQCDFIILNNVLCYIKHGMDVGSSLSN